MEVLLLNHSASGCLSSPYPTMTKCLQYLQNVIPHIRESSIRNTIGEVAARGTNRCIIFAGLPLQDICHLKKLGVIE
jgi:hypothetical protein